MGSTEKNKIGKVLSINISQEKGTVKKPVEKAKLIEQFGVEGDAHAGKDDLRQISLLAWESIEKMQACPKVKRSDFKLKPGDFAENITTEGLILADLKIGDRIKIGQKVILEISKIGKECHTYCEIFKKLGTCIMPKEGIFGRVLKDGTINIKDKIEVMNDKNSYPDNKQYKKRRY